MTAPHDNPALVGRPIILDHLEDPPGSGLTACTGQPFSSASAQCFPQIARVLCSLCQARSLGLRLPPEVSRLDLVDLQPGDTIIATVPNDTSSMAASNIKTHLTRELGPAHRVLVKTEALRIEIHRDVDDEAAEAQQVEDAEDRP